MEINKKINENGTAIRSCNHTSDYLFKNFEIRISKMY